eukprot:CAMPEP_0114430350 /NCGR_PEP_ID=MMETSP0103-20121206/9995_1 /TAXON_ID=37642 ORGANISM="Paraphysomonas imperforata, Strain PA2" /NCGR_SAMPLE_ID=MMETSP0103 /ASSEMBLY_ACC=CAM_ASM_000201 /LENGTH=342 /DNA_ID=CAMNT_0001599793 /DNA_START=121 /DNA_END=1146 /DNA_ORIENTATION=-
MPVLAPYRILLLLECLCLFFLIVFASEPTSDSVPADSATCLSQTALDVANAEIEELTSVNADLIKLIEELRSQQDNDKCQDDQINDESAEHSEESLLEERDVELSAFETTDIASASEVKIAVCCDEKTHELEEKIEKNNILLEEADTKLKEALADLQEAKEVSVASQLEASACEQAVVDLKEDLEKRNSLVDNLSGQLDMASADFKAYKVEVRQLLLDAQSTHATHTTTCSCNFDKCQSAFVSHFGLQNIAESGKHLFAEYSAHCVATISMIYTHIERFYSRHLEHHVDALMQSEHVKKFLTYVDYVEGKIHVFLYFTWKDTPRIVLKVARETQYLGYFLHW